MTHVDSHLPVDNMPFAPLKLFIETTLFKQMALGLVWLMADVWCVVWRIHARSECMEKRGMEDSTDDHDGNLISAHESLRLLPPHTACLKCDFFLLFVRLPLFCLLSFRFVFNFTKDFSTFSAGYNTCWALTHTYTYKHMYVPALGKKSDSQIV